MMMLTVYEDAIYMESNIIGIREWDAYGSKIRGGTIGGLSTLNGNGLIYLGWQFATLRCYVDT